MDSTTTHVVKCLLLTEGLVIAQGRRGGHLTSFTFRWSAKTKAEGRISKHHKYLSVGKVPRARGRKLWDELSETSKRTDWDETWSGFLQLWERLWREGAWP